MPEPFTDESPACSLCGAPFGGCSHNPGAPIDPKPRMTHLLPPDPAATVIVDREVWEQAHDMYGRPMAGQRLIYRPGDRITPEEARRVGLWPALEHHDPAPTETK